MTKCSKLLYTLASLLALCGSAWAAGDITYQDQNLDGQTLYGIVQCGSGDPVDAKKFYNMTTNLWVAALTDTRADFDIDLGTGGGQGSFFGDVPTHANFGINRPVDVFIYQRAGVSPAKTDQMVAQISFVFWDGTRLGPNPLTSAIRTSVAQAGTPTSITLDASASAVNGFYDELPIRILRGTGAGQVRWGYSYNGTTKVLTVKRPWKVVPDATSVYVIQPFPFDFVKWLVGAN